MGSVAPDLPEMRTAMTERAHYFLRCVPCALNYESGNREDACHQCGRPPQVRGLEIIDSPTVTDSALEPIPEHVHGTLNGYDYWICRCDDCKAAKSRKNAGITQHRRDLRLRA